MRLHDSTRKFIEKERLFSVSDSVLIGVSGGKDSMCLLHVLQKCRYNISVVHVNYQLRGEESEKDEQLVVTYCKENAIDYHIHTVSKKEAQSLQEENLQEVARDIRYGFFERLQVERDFDKIAIAHHRNDVTETFILNALRGSGSAGLRSIQSKSGIIVRPFLFSTQEDISNYALINKIPYRNDESNKSNKYTRNFIRNKVIPELEMRWPLAVNKISLSAALLSDENKLLHHLINQEKNRWIKSKNGNTEIGPISKIVLLPGHKTMLWHWLKDYGITQSGIISILESYQNTGNDFSTYSHSIIIDRDFLKIEDKTSTSSVRKLIKGIGSFLTDLGLLKIEDYTSIQNSDVLIEIIDLAKIQYPLTLRPWQKGDRWQPLGMKGKRKKISDYLIDKKIDRLAKNKVLVLVDAKGIIIWLVGHRISEEIKTSEHTSSRLQFSWQPKST
ncbi:MAG: tRNA(Ile)-lysidine synthase [Saprospiraceae bacterium]|jgi:tRNA(Ile)-lysidine synthase